jgi:hypothetical protein
MKMYALNMLDVKWCGEGRASVRAAMILRTEGGVYLTSA